MTTITSPAQWLTVLTTTSAADKAEHLARGAVELRTAAHVQASGPVTSVFRWKGEIGTAQEWQVRFTTAEGRYPELANWLVSEHDHEVPEIIATQVVRGSDAYVTRLEQETAG